MWKRDNRRTDALDLTEKQKVAHLAARMNRGVASATYDAAKKVLGDSVDQTPIAGLVFQSVHENVSLMDKAKSGYGADIAKIVADPASWTGRWEDLRAKIAERGLVAESHATLIAKDQTLKFNSAVNKARMQTAGFRGYTWSTSHDERVRADHEALDGQSFDWDSPPVTNKKTGAHNHPGEDIQCRCVPIPNFDTLSEEEQTVQGARAELAEGQFVRPTAVESTYRGAAADVVAGKTSYTQFVSDLLTRGGLPAPVPHTYAVEKSVVGTLGYLDAKNRRVVIDKPVHDKMVRQLQAFAKGGKVVPEATTILHEYVHTVNMMNPESYERAGAAIEEVVTELNARRIQKQAFGPSKKPSYEAIIQRMQALIASEGGVTSEEAGVILDKASIAYKHLPSSETVEDSIRKIGQSVRKYLPTLRPTFESAVRQAYDQFGRRKPGSPPHVK